MTNAQIAKIFGEIADLLELKGESPFRIRAYRRAAMNVEAMPKDLSTLGEEELTAIPGIGRDLAGKIRQYAQTGRVDLYEELKNEVPAGLLSILRIPGVGPKTARMLFDKRNVKSIEELEALAREKKLSGLPGIQEKTEENILKGIEQVKKGRERFSLGMGLPVARNLLRLLQESDPRGKFALAGSIRRWRETIKDIDILAAGKRPENIAKAFVRLSAVKEVLEQGTTKCSVLTPEGIQVDLRVVEESSFGAALQYFTGSKAHNIKLREMASRRGWKINEYGLFRESDGKRIAGREEEEIYSALGLPWIPPELREDAGEIEAALEGKLPGLLELADIRGDLHAHTRWSDGSHELDDLVAAAKARGYRYLAVTDHSKGLGIAHGLDENRVREQIARIDAANRKLSDFRILKGIEVDIRGDGALDLDDEVLSRLDIVVASIHSGFRQGKERITNRLLSAVRNPFVSVIAHPTGRLIGERDPYEADLEAVFREAARRGIAMEINANPMRLDLSDRHARMAKQVGIPLVVSTDVHITANLDYMEYGVGVARRGWIGKGDVLNTLGTAALLKRLAAMRHTERPDRKRKSR
ncbi:MAG: DNA polymerase/3'-5' exonuclease PolX [Deltaproteobacteria bacterium]|nr:DNA polymerase/3'-5' exonuclease PolX [Deltaproteobacteria bacterium]PWB67516.1 MAG: DNA polymerase/3'-5' exonuclease PolX [Deltaproteobacteria bacterium]